MTPDTRQVYMTATVNIMFHGLINPCIHLMES